MDLLNSNLRFAEISAGKAKAQKRALEQYQILTSPGGAILRFALRSVSYSAKVQICTLEQYQPVTAATAPASSTGGLIALSLHKQERRARC
ncbi:hypothetical protein ACSFM0_001099 [Escherichia coli]|uniref:hypothetical protein n=1 Tax=Escherichia coli TaxID=562 RepID=UPI0017629D86|nr:hypothetical protein [Escherichia coli]EED1399098.1 hypothetical protein [Escherichia coli]EET7762924.1 hypothetical protein [Escherichia coli]EFI8018923.1 hypothetical protein [Escherichia coli]EGT1034530.1 hypothetical protein [Escherichia coli]EHO7074903.1 hypothetical protein [Escherichia coli]